MMAKNIPKMPLPKLDDLFTTEEERTNDKLEKVIDIKLSDIDDFPDQPFKVIENEDMYNMRDSINQFLHYGYLKDKDGLKFTIGNDTHYSHTTYGAFITVTYKNTPIKGQLEIKKTGENLVIKDGKYTYKDKKLRGVTFEIYAEEGIKSADGKIDKNLKK